MRAVLSTILLLSGCGGSGGGAPAPIAFSAPRNPHLADSNWPIFHGDSYAQHFSTLPGVEGRGTVMKTEVPLSGVPVFVLFDPEGTILTVTKSVAAGKLWKIDRQTLMPLGSVDLPDNGGTFSGAYGFVDDQGRAVLGTGKSILRYTGGAGAPTLETTADLTATLPDSEVVVAVSALYSGDIAFLSSDATLGVLPADLSGAPVVTRLAGERVYNGLSTDETGGLFVVTDAAMYRFDWAGGALTQKWREEVQADFPTPRPGRLGVGSGTTPVLMMDDALAIADDAASMNLIVLRRASDTAGAPRQICKVPAFDGDAATDNAIVVAGRTMIIEQNLSDHPGLARFDVEDDGTCTKAWTAEVLARTCVPTLSTASNLVYAYVQKGSTWGLEGLELATGEERFFAPAGDGFPYDNLYAAVTVGPDARIYIGTVSGLMVFADAQNTQ